MSSFNTQPPEGGCELSQYSPQKRSSFNTQPPEGGCIKIRLSDSQLAKFQHTAARRRLPLYSLDEESTTTVSTHSRPKAAAPYIKKQEKSVY